MKKIKNVVMTVVLASSMVVTPVLAQPSVDELEESKAAAESEVSSLQNQLTDLMSKLGKLESDLIAKGEEITKAEADLEGAKKKEKKQYEDMKKRIKFMYEEGGTSALETLVTADNFSDLVNKAEYVQNVHTYDRKMLKEYVDTKQSITELKSKLETEQANLESLQSEYRTKETELSTTIETKKAEIADFDSRIQEAAEAAARAAQEAQAERERQAQAAADNSSSGNLTPSNSVSIGSADISYGGGGNTSAAQAIVSAAYSQLGVPYVWGGTSPGSGLDCSGLTQYCHSAAGISIPRTSEVQGGGGMAVSSPQPGDLVCYGGHIGIYIGNGQMIHAPEPGDVVKVSSVYGSPWYRRYW